MLERNRSGPYFPFHIPLKLFQHMVEGAEFYEIIINSRGTKLVGTGVKMDENGIGVATQYHKQEANASYLSKGSKVLSRRTCRRTRRFTYSQVRMSSCSQIHRLTN